MLEEWGECVFLFQQKLIVGFESDLVENLPFSGGKLSEKVDHSGSEWKARRAEEMVGENDNWVGSQGPCSVTYGSFLAPSRAQTISAQL